MKRKPSIDALGRIVIPKELRDRYGLDASTPIEFAAMPDGILMVPEKRERRIVRSGRIVSIDTGAGVADAGDFDMHRYREQRLSSITDFGNDRRR